jgi:ABC-type phosphate/phosphonate transport system substrate-binding protein
MFVRVIEMIFIPQVNTKLVRKMRHIVKSAILFFVVLLLGMHAEKTTAQTSSPAFLRIGFLPNDPEAQVSPGAFYELREYLLAHPPFLKAMQEAGIEDIALIPVDRHDMMIQRMNRNELDLAFCSAVDFVFQTGDYEAYFQLRRSEDSFDPRGKRVFHKGVIFVNNRSPLYSANLSPGDFADTLTTTPIAMVSDSAAGYFYPALRIARLSSRHTLPLNIHLCDSSEEVVKTVINGLADNVSVGACEASALDKVLSQYGLLEYRAELVRVILETDPIPAEPVALHRKWLPRYSSLGRELSEALWRFFSPQRGLPALEYSSTEKYQDLRESIREFWGFVGEREPDR